MKRYNIHIGDKRTTVKLEPEFWNAIKYIAKRENMLLRDLFALIRETKKGNMASAIRVYALVYFKGEKL